jgi:ParB-like nuclease family protein
VKFGKWVDEGERAARTPEMALALLRAIPGSGETIPVPLRFIDRAGYQKVIGNREMNARIDAAPIHTVPLDSLVAIQHTVLRKQVEHYIETDGRVRRGTKHSDHGGVVDLPIVVRCGGTSYLFDGHHRVTAHKLLGARLVRCRYVDLDASDAADAAAVRAAGTRVGGA